MITTIIAGLASNPQVKGVMEKRALQMRAAITGEEAPEDTEEDAKDLMSAALGIIGPFFMFIVVLMMISVIATGIIISRTHPNMGTFGAVITALFFGDLWWYFYFMPRTCYRFFSGKPISETLNFDRDTGRDILRNMSKNGGDHVQAILAAHSNMQG